VEVPLSILVPENAVMAVKFLRKWVVPLSTESAVSSVRMNICTCRARHKQSFCATRMSSGVASRVTLTRVSRGFERDYYTGGGSGSDFVFKPQNVLCGNTSRLSNC
jgi:hypothetical protein